MIDMKKRLTMYSLHYTYRYEEPQMSKAGALYCDAHLVNQAMNIIEGEHVALAICPMCGCKVDRILFHFVEKHNYRGMQFSKTGIPIGFVCVCGKVFNRLEYLVQHINDHHQQHLMHSEMGLYDEQREEYRWNKRWT